MTDDKACQQGGPGAPCTFDPTPRQLYERNKALTQRCRDLEVQNKNLIDALKVGVVNGNN